MEIITGKDEIAISVLIPIYNEEAIIPELYRRIRESVSKISTNYELFFLNDGSTDNSLFEIIRLTETDKRVFFINFSRNFGHQIAVSAGLDHCNGEIVIIIDGDLQDPPELIPQLYEKYKEGFEVVYAKRAKRKGETWFKKTSAKLFYRILKNITSTQIPVDTGDFRLIDKKVVDYLRQMPEQNKFLRGQIAWLGFRQTHILYERDDRKTGKTGYTFSKMFSLAMDAVTGFSNVPLKLVSRLGFIMSFISLLVIIYAVFAHYVLERTITGWTSLIICIVFFGGIQLISIGIIGEYISRINKNILQRPLYIIESNNLKITNDEDRPTQD